MTRGDADASDRATTQALEDTGKTPMLRADMPGVKERDVTLLLPSRVEPDKVKATLADGQLDIAMEKALDESTRHVPVHVA